MARLSSLPSRLQGLPSGHVYLPQTTQERDQHRAAVHPWRAWYKLQRWRDLRMAVFERDGFTCQMCGRLQGDTSQLTADHRRRHRGDPVLFWDPGNVQTLCTTPCHNRHKQAQEAKERF